MTAKAHYRRVANTGNNWHSEFPSSWSTVLSKSVRTRLTHEEEWDRRMDVRYEDAYFDFGNDAAADRAWDIERSNWEDWLNEQ
jgi:hypothetical protein